MENTVFYNLLSVRETTFLVERFLIPLVNFFEGINWADRVYFLIAKAKFDMVRPGSPERSFQCHDYMCALIYPIFFVVFSGIVSCSVLYVSHRSLLGQTDASEETLDEGSKNGWWFNFKNRNYSGLAVFGWASLFYVPYLALVAVVQFYFQGKSCVFCCAPTCSAPVDKKATKKIAIVHMVGIGFAFFAVIIGGALGVERFNNSILSAQGGIHTNMDPTKPLDKKIKGGIIQFKAGSFLNMKQTGVYYQKESRDSPWLSIAAIPIIQDTQQTNIFYWGGGCWQNSECVRVIAPRIWFRLGITRPKWKGNGTVCERWRRVSSAKKGKKSNLTMGVILRNAPNCNPRGARIEATSKFKLKTDQNNAVTVRVHEDPEALIKMMALAGLRGMIIPVAIAHAIYLVALFVAIIHVLRKPPDAQGSYQPVSSNDDSEEA